MTRAGPVLSLLGGGALMLTACAGAGEPESASTTTNPPVMSNPEPTFTSTPTPTPEPKPREFTVVATGDVLLHERLWAQAERDAHDDGTWNFAPQLERIKPVIEEAGLAICHMEVPLAPEDGPYQGYPYFSGPPQIVPALAETGYDACTTASNHTFDQGAEGVERTLNVLDRAGMAHAGSARTEAEGKRPTVISVDTPNGPVQVGLLSYTYGFNGIPYPDGDSWRGNEIDEDAILAEAAAARKDGAEVVIAAMHWGNEYAHEPNEQQLELSPRLLESPDIDLLLGHHAHVVQPIEQIDDEWVVYGMGNLMANHAEPEGPKSEGLLTRFTITESLDDNTFTTTGAEYLPLYQTYTPPVEVLDVPAAVSSGETGTAGQSRLERALERTVEVVERRGGADDGLTMISSAD